MKPDLSSVGATYQERAMRERWKNGKMERWKDGKKAQGARRKAQVAKEKAD